MSRVGLVVGPVSQAGEGPSSVNRRDSSSLYFSSLRNFEGLGCNPRGRGAAARLFGAASQGTTPGPCTCSEFASTRSTSPVTGWFQPALREPLRPAQKPWNACLVAGSNELPA